MTSVNFETVTLSGVLQAEHHTPFAVGSQTIYLNNEQTAALKLAQQARFEAFAGTTAQLFDMSDYNRLPVPGVDTLADIVPAGEAGEPGPSSLYERLKAHAIDTFASPSLLGLQIGSPEKNLLQAYQYAAARLVSNVNADPSQIYFLEEVHRTIQAQQQTFQEHGIESPTTQYWHFTPHTLRLARRGKLASSAHPETENLTTAKSYGAHFVRSGEPHCSWAELWSNLAHSIYSFEADAPIPEAYGTAIVLPLGKLATATPLRNEQRYYDGNSTPHSPDATFRTATGSDVYSYDLDDAFLVPWKGKQQFPEIQDEGAPLRQALSQAGKDEAWMEHHMVNLPADADTPARLQAATRAIARSTQQMYPGQSVIALTSQPGEYEGLDGSPQPRIERIALVKTLSTRKSSV